MRIPINFNHLYYFYVIAHEGSIADASNVLHLTPSTLSNQLREFEDFLGVKLFEREHRKLILNTNGVEAYEYASTIFASADGFLDKLRLSALEEPIVTVGLSTSIYSTICHNLFNFTFQKNRLFVRTIRTTTDCLLKRMEINEIDVVVSDRPLKKTIPGLALQKISNDALFLVVSLKHHPHFDVSDIKTLNGLPFINFTNENPLRQELELFLNTNRLNPRMIGECDDPSILIRQTFLNGTVTAIAEKYLKQIPFPDTFLLFPTTLFQEHWLIYRESNPLAKCLTEQIMTIPN